MILGKLLQGPDVSSWQPGVLWPAVAAAGECYFGFAKATESTYYRDATYAGNRAGMRAIGCLMIGGYCFAQPGDMRAEAEFFAADVGEMQADEAAVLDAEVSGLDADGCIEWAGRIAELEPGRRRILYCSTSYWTDVLGADPRLIQPDRTPGAFDALWAAAYHTPHFDADGNLTNGPDDVPWTWWQYTDGQRIDGIPGTCDDSFFRGTVADLRAFMGTPDPSKPAQEEDNMWLIEAPPERGGGTYQTDGDRAWGVPSEAWLQVFFFGTTPGKPGPLADRHLGVVSAEVFDTFTDREGKPRNPGVVPVP